MPPRRQKPESGRVSIVDADTMLMQQFRLHCQKRHPQMKFWSIGEHIADHRLHDDSLNHIHTKEAPTEEEGSTDA